MLFDYAQVTAGRTVLIHGAAGNVGAYAVQLASQAGLHMVATDGSAYLDDVRGLGAETVVDYKKERFEVLLSGVDVVLYAVGGAYFYVDVTTTRLNKITELFENGKLNADVGTVLPLEDARIAHEMF